MSISGSVDRDILSFFKKIEDRNTNYINRLIVSSFIITHNLEVHKNNILFKYKTNDNSSELQSLIEIIRNSSYEFGLEELVEVFEYVISPADKEVNGAVYTPAYIRENIITQILSVYEQSMWLKLLYADLSCGCGGFFYTLLKFIKQHIPEVSVANFVRNNIVGIDIKSFSVERTKILLAIYALLEGEELSDDAFNIYCQNSLSNDFVEIEVVERNGGIDVVMGNPPYVASSKISDENRIYIKKWGVSKTGKSDLYLPFFQLGLESLKENGVLGYITVNTFYRSLNGTAFREYMSNLDYDCTIIDFGAEQLFRGCSTYTCVCIILKRKTGQIHYVETNSLELGRLKGEDYETIPYSILDNKKGWILKDKKTSERIRAIELIGKPLGEIVDIKNGFATLRNDIYLIRPIRQDVNYFYFKKNGCEYQVERSICREAIKANLVRTEEDIQNLKEYIIFPYRLDNGQQVLLDEENFKRDYPYAYSYLIYNKEELAKRDKGHKQYPKWYAYGRSQALNLEGVRLLYPHICNAPCFVYSANNTMMFYDGYSIFAKNLRQLKIIHKILTSNIFWYYITKTSKPYSGGFFSLEKRYIKHFGIPTFSIDEENELLSMTDKNEIEKWLREHYNLG